MYGSKEKFNYVPEIVKFYTLYEIVQHLSIQT